VKLVTLKVESGKTKMVTLTFTFFLKNIIHIQVLNKITVIEETN